MIYAKLPHMYLSVDKTMLSTTDKTQSLYNKMSKLENEVY